MTSRARRRKTIKKRQKHGAAMRAALLALALLTALSACGRKAPLEVPPPPGENRPERSG